MGSKKTVTEKTLAANRRNAKRSTGPRTEMGKNNSKFNAVKTGLFAEHVVIPSCDGGYYEDDPDPKEQFLKLIQALQQEYKPQGPSEVFWVEQMAECMWKQRRVSRSEGRFVQLRSERKTSAPGLAEQIVNEIWILERAQEEIETTRTLSPATYGAVLPALNLAATGVLQPRGLEAKNDSTPNELELDDQFVASLEKAKAKIGEVLSHLADRQKIDDYQAARALPAEGDMDQILRYDRALQKKFDWALQRLLESQQRRRKAQVPASV